MSNSPAWWNKHHYKRNGRTHEQTSCLDKRVYHDPLTATKACLSIERQDPSRYVRIYQCIYCEGIHITSGGIRKEISGLRKFLSSNLRQMRQPDWWMKCPKELREEMITEEVYILRRLLKLMEMS